jgi:hypothetical protein
VALKAKCPQCDKSAQVNEQMTEVICRYCRFRASYDDYIEMMKDRAAGMIDSFQMKWDRNYL